MPTVFDRTTNTAACTGGNHPLLFSVRTNYLETKGPQETLI